MSSLSPWIAFFLFPLETQRRLPHIIQAEFGKVEDSWLNYTTNTMNWLTIVA